MTRTAPAPTGHAARALLLPLALAQFICSFAGSNMNVMITDMSKSLNTTVQGIQVAITVFLLVMAAFMIPGGKLTDRYGRTRCFTIGLVVYGVGAVLSAVAPGLGILILGNSLLEGIGTALLIPPVYILATLYFTEVTSRAKAFGTISAMGGVGAAAGPLIGGLITSAISWRAAFVFQALVIVVIVLMSRKIHDPVPADRSSRFDIGGAVLSSVGLILVVTGILMAEKNLWATLGLMCAGALVLAWFIIRARRWERTGRDPLLSPALFRNRISNLGLITQNLQWAILLGTSFTVASYLQVVRHYDAIKTGVLFTSATAGLLLASFGAERFAKRRTQRTLILGGFVITVVGIVLLVVLVGSHSNPWASAPGLFLMGAGVGVMLTPSVNVVQSSFPERMQGEISGLSRSVSNLGSSFGTAIAGTILVSGLTHGAYAAAMGALALAALIGVGVSIMLPHGLRPKAAAEPAPAVRTA